MDETQIQPKPGDVVKPTHRQGEPEITPTPFPNPFNNQGEAQKPKAPSELEKKLAELPELGKTVIKSKKFKKIAVIVAVVAVVFISLGAALTYVLPIIFPPQEEEVYVPPVISEPPIKEPPKEDKTSLRYLDGKIKELQPVLDELNNDSLFILRLNLGGVDFKK
uniref:Uncharacterized protein n=1 Tax=candidate division WWE3 bacterium TaxID=2053526 RepID=A0A7C4TJX5_UNCKA